MSSSIIPFATSFAKFNIIDPSSIIVADRVPIQTDVTGYFLTRTYYQALKIKSLLINIYNHIPLIAGGAQPSLEIDYNRISNISGSISVAIQQFDSVMPDELKAGTYLQDAFTKLASLKSYLSILGSTTAPTYQSMIPQFQDTIIAAIENIDKIINDMSLRDQQLIDNLIQIPEANFPLVHQAAAILTMIEKCVIDFDILLAEPTILKNETQLKDIRSTCEMLDNYSRDIFESALQDVQHLISSTAIFLRASPSPFQLLSNIQDLIPSPSDFQNYFRHLLSLSSLTINLATSTTASYIPPTIDSLTEAIIHDQPLNNLQQTAKVFLDTALANVQFPFFYRNSKYASVAAHSLSALDSIRSSNPTPEAIIEMCRFYASTVDNSAASKAIFDSISKCLHTVIGSLLSEAQSLSKDITSIFSSGLNFFNEKTLSDLNFHITSLSSLSKYDPSSPSAITSLRTFFASITQITKLLPKFIEGCTSPKLKTQLQAKVPLCEKVSRQIHTYLYQLFLTVITSVYLQVEDITNVLNFMNAILPPSSLPQGHEIVSDVQLTFKSTPQYLWVDIAQAFELGIKYEEISNLLPKYLEVISATNEDPLYPLLVQAADTFPHLQQEINPLFLQISGFLKFVDRDDFVSFMSSSVSDLIEGIHNSMDIFSKNKAAFAAIFGICSTTSLMLSAMIRLSGSFASPVSRFQSFITSPLDVVWPIASNIALGIKNVSDESSNLPIFVQSLTKQLTELLNSLNSMPQPTSPVNIPEELRELKRFETQVSQIEIPIVKEISTNLLDLLRNKLDVPHRSLIRTWLEIASSNPQSIRDSSNNLSLLCTNSSDSDIKLSLFQRLSAFAISLSAFSSEDTSLQNHFNQAGRDISMNLFSIADEPISESTIMNAYHLAVTHLQTMLYLSLKPQNIKKTLISILTDCIISLRDRLSSSTIAVLTPASHLCALSAAFHLNPDLSISGIPDFSQISSCLSSALISGDRSTASSQISSLSQLFSLSNPSRFTYISNLSDINIINDNIYDQFELFHDHAVELQNNSHYGPHLSQVAIASCETIGLAQKALSLQHHDNSSFTLSFISSACSTFHCLTEYSSALSSGTLTPTNSRKIKRRLNRQFDTFINFIENSAETQDSSTAPIDIAKLNLYHKLIPLCVSLARLSAFSAHALVPEMYSKERESSVADIKATLEPISKAIKDLKALAVGPSAEDLPAISEPLQKLITSAISEHNPDFTKEFPPEKLLTATDNIAKLIDRLLTLMPDIVDKIRIDPDPISAARIPQQFTAPAVDQRFAMPASEARTSLGKSAETLEKTLEEVEVLHKGEYVQALDIVESTLKLENDSAAFIKAVNVMIVATADPRTQVEFQTVVHSFGSAISTIFGGARSRLLIIPEYSQQISNGIKEVRAAITKLLSLGDTAATYVETTGADDEEVDDATRELMATAHAIEEMSSRLAAFSQQFSEPEKEEEEKEEEEIKEEIKPDEENRMVKIDVDAEQGSLPAYVVQHATPILQTTTLIVKRAQEITADLVAKLGKLENEKLLIKAAQELSESAELLIITAEMLVSHTNSGVEPEYSVIAAAKIIKAAVASLVAEVLVKGGDTEGIMNKYVKNVQNHADKVIKKGEAIVFELLEGMAKKVPSSKNKLIMTLNMTNYVNQMSKNLMEAEKNLKDSRKRNFRKP